MLGFLLLPVAVIIALITSSGREDKTFTYPDFKIVVTENIARHCKHIKIDDYGHETMENPLACYSDNIIYVPYNDPGLLIHELCHEQGIDAKTCAEDYKL